MKVHDEAAEAQAELAAMLQAEGYGQGYTWTVAELTDLLGRRPINCPIGEEAAWLAQASQARIEAATRIKYGQFDGDMRLAVKLVRQHHKRWESMKRVCALRGIKT